MSTAILTATYTTEGFSLLTRRATIRNDDPRQPEGIMGPALFGAMLSDVQAEVVAEMSSFMAAPVRLEQLTWTAEPDRFGQRVPLVPQPATPAEAWEKLLVPFPPMPRPPCVHSAVIVDPGHFEYNPVLACTCGEWKTEFDDGDTLVSLGDEFAEHLIHEFHPHAEPRDGAGWLLHTEEDPARV
jgi:hypothetical protein